MKKKVLHIVEAFGGGVFTMINDLTNGLKDEYDIVIAYGKRKQTPENLRELFDSKIKLIEIKNFGRKLNLKKDIKALNELKKVIKEEKPDIVHLHSSKAGVLGRIAANGKKYKMLYNPHGFSFLKQDDSKIKRLCYKTIEKIMAIINMKCIIIGCSEGEYKEAKKISKNAVCINNGIDIEKLTKKTEKFQKTEIDFENLKICTVGRIGYQKNPKLFNEIAGALPDNKFTWIGDGELKKELTSSNITVTGWKKEEEVLKELNKNDIFILTSLWEGLPISLLEAGYMKKICLVTDVIGNKDVIKNGKNGFIFNKTDEAVKIIQKINMKKYDEVTKKIRKEIEQIYNSKVMIEQYRKQYEEIK